VAADVAVLTGFLACCVGLTTGGGVCEADLTGGMDETEEEEEEGCVADGGAAEEDGWEGFCDAFTCRRQSILSSLTRWRLKKE
jgi:hypothetical protein